VAELAHVRHRFLGVVTRGPAAALVEEARTPRRPTTLYRLTEDAPESSMEPIRAGVPGGVGGRSSPITTQQRRRLTELTLHVGPAFPEPGVPPPETAPPAFTWLAPSSWRAPSWRPSSWRAPSSRPPSWRVPSWRPSSWRAPSSWPPSWPGSSSPPAPPARAPEPPPPRGRVR